jgi:probable F420-dependent oxidoreductase
MSSKLEIYASTPENLGLADIGAHARRVEALGYDGLFVPDAVHDGLLLACQALSATTHLHVSISVLVALPRSPMNVALAAWDLQRMSGGRFELGLGTQIRQNIEERYSARWLPPASGMKEYIGALRAIFHSFRTREPLDFVGEHYRFTRLQPFFNPGPLDVAEAGITDPPIMLGAVGPRMLALAGAVADGLHTHPTNTSPRYLREVIQPCLNAGYTRRDAALAPLKRCANILVASGPDAASVAAERERFRNLLAFLFSTPAYWPSLELFGWHDLGPQLQQLTRVGRWQEMSKAMVDHVLDEFLVCAAYDELADSLHARYAGQLERLTVTVPDSTLHDAALASTLQAIRARFVQGMPRA